MKGEKARKSAELNYTKRKYCVTLEYLLSNSDHGMPESMGGIDVFLFVCLFACLTYKGENNQLNELLTAKTCTQLKHFRSFRQP